jgi:hypothetical protein
MLESVATPPGVVMPFASPFVADSDRMKLKLGADEDGLGPSDCRGTLVSLAQIRLRALY